MVLIAIFPAPTSQAVEIQDITRIKGQEANRLHGIGLVTGLDGTGGDTKKTNRLKRPLLIMFQEAGFGTQSLDEMAGIDSVAAVEVWCEIPRTGAREGDRFDVHVTTVGDATSLEGGMLLQTPMKPARWLEPYAAAAGPIEIIGENKRHGIVRGGVQMLKDIRTNIMQPGSSTFTLILDSAYAEYPVADAIKNLITQEFSIDEATVGDVWAEVTDNKNIVVHLASWLKDDPSTVISRIMTLDLDSHLLQIPARVMINRKAGTILVTGDVEISAAVINSKGLSITRITPEPVPSSVNPVYETRQNVAVESVSAQTPTQQARLQDLLEALEALKVPFDERISILQEMHKMGVLHAQLIEH